MNFAELIIHTDGGARGNPGPAAVGGVIESKQGDKRLLVYELRETIGETTNNVAEYTAVVKTFAYLQKQRHTADVITVFLDSKLVAEQLSGRFKIKKYHLQSLYVQVKDLERQVSKQVAYVAIPRLENFRADQLVNQALDSV